MDAAFIKLLKGKAIGVDSVIKGVAICLEPEFFDAFMKDSKQAATYFANMLRSLVRRQVWEPDIWGDWRVGGGGGGGGGLTVWVAPR